MIQRVFNISKSHSFILFGPRGTGKTTLISKEFAKLSKAEKLSIDLLDDDFFSRYQSRPSLLKEEIEQRQHELKWVLIDEIQRVPELLNICHLIIEKHKHIKFALTGSSARKLKKGQANLLAGRAFAFYLHPLLYSELPESIPLEQYLTYGGLPKLLTLQDNKDKRRFLNSYVQTYLREEIIAEQLVRNINGFRKFLEIAAQMDTQILNYHYIAKDTGLDDKTVARFFDILQDTLVAQLLEPFDHSIRKRQKQKPKFYLFDTGVVRAMNQTLDEEVYSSTTEFGNLFEQMVINQFYSLRDYHEKNWRFSYLRTQTDLEIDLIIQQKKDKYILVEIKSSQQIKDEHLKSLRLLGADFPKAEKYVLCREPSARLTEDGIHILPWQEGLHQIYGEDVGRTQK